MVSASGGKLPRDTDPVTRAAYGYLLQIENDKELIVIPLVNDSSRKVAYLLKRKGKNVYTVTVPPIKKESTVAEWKRQMELLAERLFILNKKLARLQEDTGTGAAQVLLIGSPIYFPNYKVPYLLQETGFHLQEILLFPTLKNLMTVKKDLMTCAGSLL